MSKERIVILGGGAAALATAFDLTREPDWQDRYQVTVYTQGWRLGGKGASSRDPERSERIVEHGLHVLLGSYHHTFRMMRQAYEELDRPSDHTFPTWRSAVAPVNRTVLMEQVDGEWVPWDLIFPVIPGMPGEGDEHAPDAGQCLRRLLTWIFNASDGQGAGDPEEEDEPERELRAPGLLRTLVRGRLDRLQKWGPRAGDVQSLIERASGLVDGLELDGTGLDEQRMARPLRDNLHQLGALISEARENDHGANLHLRRFLLILELACAAVRGMLLDRVLTRGFDALDGEDLRDWLRRHGACEEALGSTLVRSLYDLTFAYRYGDPDQPALAAGAGLRGALRMFLGYRGGFLWKMQAGMGDVVFAPLYQVLRSRGVQFRFFHKVRALEANGGRIQVIRIGRQATPTGSYQPLIDVAGLPCWPLTPHWDQLAEGDELQARAIDLENTWSDWQDVATFELRDGRDFDRVVLGIPVGALPRICGDLARKKRRWQRLFDQVGTVATQSAQLWLDTSTADLGWQPDGPIAAGYADPFDSWADMSHLLAEEPWASPQPRHLSYLLGAMRDDGPAIAAATEDYPLLAQARVRDQLEVWLRTESAGLWPGAQRSNGKGFRWNLLVDPHHRQGSARLDYHVIRANVQPSDRYVLTLPGATRARLRPGKTGFENLVVCGDWTRNDMNVGSVEAAVLSGLIASRVVKGEPHEDELRC